MPEAVVIPNSGFEDLRAGFHPVKTLTAAGSIGVHDQHRAARAWERLDGNPRAKIRAGLNGQVASGAGMKPNWNEPSGLCAGAVSGNPGDG